MNRKIVVIISIIFLIGFILVYKPVLSQDNTDPYIKANSMLISGNFEEAIRYYNIVIKQSPKLSEAYIGLGMAYKESGRYQEAYDVTLKAIKLKPSYYQAYYNLGLILEKQGKADEAINAYEKFMKEIPGADRFSDVKQRIVQLKKNR